MVSLPGGGRAGVTDVHPWASHASAAPKKMHIGLSPVSDTFCMIELINNLISGQYLCIKFPKPVTIKYL